MGVMLAAACGLYCGECEYFGQCPGCRAVEGKPGWTVEYGIEVCGMYRCSVLDRGHEHCGECEQLPCDMFARSWDPSLTDEQGHENVRQRVSDLRRRKEVGTESWLRDRGPT